MPFGGKPVRCQTPSATSFIGGEANTGPVPHIGGLSQAVQKPTNFTRMYRGPRTCARFAGCCRQRASCPSRSGSAATGPSSRSPGLAAVGLAIFAAARGDGAAVALATGAPVAACALLAGWPRLGREVRTLAGSAGLIAAAALLAYTLEASAGRCSRSSWSSGS